MTEERLQKILARAGAAPSRRKAEELIREGRVTIDGRVARLGDRADPERNAIKVDGRRIRGRRGHRYIVLHKPRGVLSAVEDDRERTTVLDLVPPRLRRSLVPVGRLDYDTQGLILLTTDGEWAQRIAHPRHGCPKTYRVKVKGHPKEAAIDLIERLEPFPRGYYTGAIGFVDRAGGLSLSVAIRTARLVGGTLDYFAGGGIVYDSDPQREVAETELKARGFLEAVRRGMRRGAAART